MADADYSSIADADPAMTYNVQGIRMTCILKEGTVTPTEIDFGYLGKNISHSGASFSAGLKKGDLVALSADTGNTVAATGGVPVVDAVSGADLAIGFMMSSPSPIRNIPASAESTWATILANNYYRLADIYIWASNIYPALTPDAASGTAVTPGNSLIWDISSAGVVYGRAGLSLADTGVYDASGADTGANGFLTEPIAIHYSASDTGTTSFFEGLRPMRTQT